MDAKQLLEEMTGTDIYDLACDYAEHEVGCADFANNWQNCGMLHPPTRIFSWLIDLGESANITTAEQIRAILSAMAIEGKTWSTFFSRDTMPKLESVRSASKSIHILLA